MDSWRDVRLLSHFSVNVSDTLISIHSFNKRNFISVTERVWRAITELLLFHILPCYSFIPNWFKLSFTSKFHTQYPKRTKWKHLLEILVNLLKIKNIYITWITAFDMTLKIELLNILFHWSSVRCFYNLNGVHLCYIQFSGDGTCTEVQI